MKAFEFTEEQVKLIIETLDMRYEDLTNLLKNQDDFEAETIQSMQIEQRDLNNLIRELRHYAIET